MKSIDAQSAVPTMQNSFVEYMGKLSNSSGDLTDGTSKVFPITTQIRKDLHVIAICEGVSLTARQFLAYYTKTTNANGEYIVSIEVPSGCECTYRIAGNKELTEPYHEEVGTSSSTVGNQHQYGHKHDGNDSHKVAFTDLAGAPGIYGYFPIFFHIDSPYTYGYFEPYTGDGGFTMPATGHITKFSYTKDDGAGNTLKNTYTIGTPIAITANDNLRLRFWDDGGTDKVTLYKNGSVAGQFGASASYVDPGGSNRNFWVLYFRYSL